MSNHTHYSSAQGSFRDHQESKHLRDELLNRKKKIAKLWDMFA